VSRLFSRGTDFLDRSLKQVGQVQITYSRGVQSAVIAACVGRTAFAQAAPAGTSGPAPAIIWGDRDYLVLAADLVLGGSAVEPQRGDRITETIAGTARTFEVLAPPGEPAWRYSDAGRTTYRIHAKEVE